MWYCIFEIHYFTFWIKCLTWNVTIVIIHLAFTRWFIYVSSMLAWVEAKPESSADLKNIKITKKLYFLTWRKDNSSSLHLVAFLVQRERKNKRTRLFKRFLLMKNANQFLVAMWDKDNFIMISSTTYGILQHLWLKGYQATKKNSYKMIVTSE